MPQPASPRGTLKIPSRQTACTVREVQLESDSEATLSPRRVQLVDAAARLFFEKGYPQTTTREITKALGLTPGALYNHFLSKEELLWVIVESAYKETERICLAAVERGGGDPTAELRELAVAMTFMHTSPYRIKAIVARTERTRLPHTQAAEIEAIHERIPRIWAATLRRGIDSGVFHLPSVEGDEPDLVVVARTMTGYCVYSGYWFGPEQPITAEQLPLLLAEFVLRMVVGQPAV